MFGKNPIRKIDRTDDGKLAVQEIFYTLQGEGPFSGTPAVFIRLAGCGLQCGWCDTEFESNIDNRMTVDEVLAKVYDVIADLSFVPMFVLTGGEPLRQNITNLVYQISSRLGQPIIQVETAGYTWPDFLPEMLLSHNIISLVCSPKTKTLHPMILKHCHHYKYVVTARNLDETDGLPTWGTQRGTMYEIGQIARPPKDVEHNIWVSPCDEKIAELNIANTKAAVESAMKFNYRLSLQVHKIVQVA